MEQRYRYRQFFLAILMAALLAGCGADAGNGTGSFLNPSDGTPPPREEAGKIEIITEAPQAPEEITESSPPPEETGPEPSDDTFVRLADHIPDILIDLKYATEDNFTGVVIYDFTDAYLRYGTVKKLAAVQEELRDSGMVLKVWDAFRPATAQFQLWEVCPDPTYVANPNTGFSSHSTGNTVDLTLAWPDGAEVQMPTGFDDFSRMADRDYSDCGEVPAGNARLLEELMCKHGFQPYFGEWWHFSDSTSYAVETAFEPSSP